MKETCHFLVSTSELSSPTSHLSRPNVAGTQKIGPEMSLKNAGFFRGQFFGFFLEGLKECLIENVGRVRRNRDGELGREVGWKPLQKI